MPKKISIYNNERIIIINKLFNILELNDINKEFSLHSLDNNIDKQNKILELETDVRKYFICSTWTCFKNKTKRKWLSMVKYIFKDMNIKLISLQIRENNLKHIDTKYKIQ